MARSQTLSKQASTSKQLTIDEEAVAQALETARETEDGIPEPQVCSTLNDALSKLWYKIQQQPDTYLMSKTEMSLFTYYQYNFTGNELAVAARKRYWDNFRG